MDTDRLSDSRIKRDATMSDEPVDLLVSGNPANANMGTVSEPFVIVDSERIVALKERPAAHELDAEYITPGLIGARIHVESSTITFPWYADAVVPRGITSVVHDPYETMNVSGIIGVEAMVVDATRTPLKARFTVPSSVPATTLQDGNVTFDAEAVDVLPGEDEVAALSEVTNVPGVVAGDDSVHEKIRTARNHGLAIDEHAPRVRGSDLQMVTRYLDNDHKSISPAEAREKAKAGLRVCLREDSASKNLADVVGLTDEVGSRRLSLCIDDRDVVDLVERGDIDFAVRKVIRLGVDPAEMVQMATVSTTESYGLPFRRIRPRAPADLVLLSDLRTWEVDHVVVDGVVDPMKGDGTPSASVMMAGTVRLEPVSAVDLAVWHAGDYPVRVRVIDVVGGLQMGRTEANVPVAPVNEERVLIANADDDVLPLAVIERHGETGGIGRGFVRGLRLERGAMGSVVARDVHNCIVAGVGHDSMATVVNHLWDAGGGIVVYGPESDALSLLAPPMRGLMSDEPLGTVRKTFESVEAVADDLGLDRDGGLMALSSSALEVVLTYQLTSNGLVDVELFEYVPTVVGRQQNDRRGA